MCAASVPDTAARAGRYGSTLASGARPALAPASAPVDGRDLPQLMCMVRDFAHLFNFTTLDGSADGDWQAFFSGDASFVLAQALCFDTLGELDLLEAIVHGEWDPKRRDFRLLGRLWALGEQVSRWALQLRAISAPHPLGTSASLTLEHLIGAVLAPLYAGIHDHASWSAVLTAMQRRHFTGATEELRWLARLWTTACSAPPSLRDGARRDAGAGQPEPLHKVYVSVVHVIEQAKRPLRACFEGTLADTFGHQPHTALMAAFLQLLRHAQADANAITGGHLDFYFRTVLRLNEAAPAAGRALLSFRALPTGPAARLAAGTRLRGGKTADGQALVFALDSATTVHHDTIAALKSVRATPGVPLWRHGPAALLRIGANALAGPVTRAAGPGWAPFGTGEATSDAEVGVLLTSPMLLLRGGRRTLRVRFKYAQGADAPYAGFDAVTRAYHDGVAEAMGPVPGRSHDTLVAQAMTDACDVWLTTAAGWQRAVGVSVRGDAGAAWIELMLVLPPDFPAVVAGPPAKDEAGGASPWPRLKIVLRPAARIYPYTYLQQLQLERVSIRARVRGLVPARVTVNGAAQPAGQPFYPFGSQPVLGAAMEVIDPELAGKAIVRGSMALAWRNLPAGADDLAQRYAGYATPALANNSFKAWLAIEREGRWSRLGAQQPLFTALDTAAAPLQAQLSLALMPAQDQARPWSALRLELSAPYGAFGQERYPQLIMEASLRTAVALGDEVANAARNAAGRPSPPAALPLMPRPPLAPQAGQLTLDYLAAEPLEAELPGAAPGDTQACYYQLGPFGYRAALPQGTTLLDGLERPGQLYIGLRDVTPGQPLALLFGMCGTARQQSKLRCGWMTASGAGAPSTALEWYYLRDNTWRRFTAGALLSDGTAGLTRSGVVRLQAPADGAIADSTLMPGGLFWIAVAADTPDAHSDITLIDTQGASATQVLAAAGAQAAPALPANSIAGFAGRPAGIEGVLQAAPTLAGRAAEHLDAFRQRISRRLRHKQRALSAIDFEQMVLGAYPDIFQAKCLSAATPPRPGVPHVQVPPGVIGMVLVPHSGAADGDPATPVVSVGLLLEIQQWLAAHASAALRGLRAFSPQYEQLKVCVQLDLAHHADAGACLLRLEAAIPGWLAPWRQAGGLLPIGGDGRGVDDLAAWLAAGEGVVRVAELKVLHVYEDDGVRRARWLVRGQPLAPSVPWAVLVPAARHAIAIGRHDAYGIGRLAVGQDDMSFAAPQPGAGLAAGRKTPPKVGAPVRIPVAHLPRFDGKPLT